MGFYRSLVLAGLFFLLAAGSGRAAVVETFRLGGWKGSAYTDDTTGRFSNCVASAQYRSGITLLVQVDTTYNWAIGFSAPNWNMKVGDDIRLQYRIDGGAWQQGTAKAAAVNLARMQMPPNGYIIKRFRRGRTLYVYDGTNNYQFRLTGTSKLMARLARCVDRNSARYGAAPGMGSAASSGASGGLGQTQPVQPTTPAAPDPQLAVEATQALFNLMGSAGLSGLKLIPGGQREENYKGLHAVAGDDARKLVAHIFAPGSYTNENELMSLIVADSQKTCGNGSFSSSTERVTVGGKAVFTSRCTCQEGDHELIERVAVVKRNAGGLFVYGVSDTYIGEGGGAPVSPPELTDAAFNSAAATAAN